MHNQGITIDGIARNEDIDDDALALACRERLVVRPHHPSRARALQSHNSRPPRPSSKTKFVPTGMDTRTACTHHDISAWPRERPSTRMMQYPIPSSRPASSAKTLLLQSNDSSTSTTTMDDDENMHGKHVTFTNDVAFPSNLEDIMRVLSPTSDNDESDEDVSESPFHLRMAHMCFRDPQWQNDALKYKSRRKLWGDTLPSGKTVNAALLAIERWQSTSPRNSKSRNSDENRPSMGDE